MLRMTAYLRPRKIKTSEISEDKETLGDASTSALDDKLASTTSCELSRKSDEETDDDDDERDDVVSINTSGDQARTSSAGMPYRTVTLIYEHFLRFVCSFTGQRYQ